MEHGTHGWRFSVTRQSNWRGLWPGCGKPIRGIGGDEHENSNRRGEIGGTSAVDRARLTELVTGLDDMGFDSLWLSEVLTGQVFDPVVGLSWAAASNPRLKIGTTMLLPGRNVLRLAKQASRALDVLSNGRLLVDPGPRADVCARAARPSASSPKAPRRVHRRGACRSCGGSGPAKTVSYEGIAGSFRDVKLWPLPVQQPLEVWLGGNGPGGARALRPALRRMAAVPVHAPKKPRRDAR